jgi:shikimate dehydrogenase
MPPPNISGRTRLIAHLGVPTEIFKSPMIYNPWFREAGVDVVVVPMGCEAGDYPAFLPLVFKLRNLMGALVTMPHKVTTVALLDEVLTSVRVSGACNAVRREPDGRLVGEMFDGEGFVRGVLRQGRSIENASALVVGTGGVGSAIAASLAGHGLSHLSLFDTNAASVEGLAQRLREHYPALAVSTGSKDPVGHDIVVNATPLGMNPDDPLPVDTDRIDRTAFVGEVVMSAETTPFLAAAKERGCATQVGTDMLFEQIPAYLEFFGLPSTTPNRLRAIAELAY